MDPERWIPLVIGMAHQVAAQLDESAEDLAGAAMLRLVKDAPRYDAACATERVFVVSRAHGAMLDHVRMWRRCRTHGAGVRLVSARNPAETAVVPTQERDVLGREARDALVDLPPRWALALRLYYWGGLTMAQVGQVLDVNESRISEIHRAAIGRLRAAMGVAA